MGARYQLARNTGPLLTASVENYLKTIYAISERGAPATITGLAARLRVSVPSVSGMIRRLAAQGMLSHKPYRGIRLTQAGRQSALSILRRHRVIETYLAEVLGYSWDRIHDEAERLEHASSDELVERMAERLGWPSADPHGSPIPARDGSVESPASRRLDTLQVGDRGRVVRVANESAAMLRYLDELELRPGTRLQVTGRAPFGGPITFRVNGRKRAIGQVLAARVLVNDSDSR